MMKKTEIKKILDSALTTQDQVRPALESLIRVYGSRRAADYLNIPQSSVSTFMSGASWSLSKMIVALSVLYEHMGEATE
jgi:predicted XRE-type DNA-binding protein